MDIDVEELIGKVIIKIERFHDDDELLFNMSNGVIYKQFHSQDCCETVYLEDIEGDLNDLIGVPILNAERVTSDTSTDDESSTWTFYKFATIKGYVTIRWYGASNGYYSEEAYFCKIQDEYPTKKHRAYKLKEIIKNKDE